MYVYINDFWFWLIFNNWEYQFNDLQKLTLRYQGFFKSIVDDSLNASFYEHRNVQFEFLCHTYQLNLKWRTMAKIVYEIFTANFNSPSILISIRCYPMAVIKVFFWTLILAGPTRGQRQEQQPICAIHHGNVPTAYCIVQGLGLLLLSEAFLLR